ncbi:MAG: kynureninase [Acidimicrobiia bacterium]|nr:kynureninase [Acidimicrobiia bacterium]
MRDAAEPLARLRDEFEIPGEAAGGEKIYLVGNSLGALPRRTREYIGTELDRWSMLGVEGHFTGELEWQAYHELLAEPMARIVGGHSDEVIVMNSLTVNLHLLFVSFYEPTPQRHKVIIEEHAFPSDHFAVESQIRQRGFDPATSLVLVRPRDGAQTLEPADILAAIDECGDELAVVWLPGVQYYTGQVLPMAEIVAAGHAVGALVGFDLAHAAGNVPVRLHDWDVDFAVWCTYKYLNSGPGGVGAAFVHRRHVANPLLPKLTGWWGTRKDTRFEMTTVFEPIPTAESWQVSNAPILPMAALRASLDLFDEAGGIGALRAKSELQIRYLDFLLDEVLGGRVESITPRAMAERGAQFALTITDPDTDGRTVFERLGEAGVSCDWRYPDVIRAAAVPLYNSFADIHRFVAILDELLPARTET